MKAQQIRRKRNRTTFEMNFVAGVKKSGRIQFKKVFASQLNSTDPKSKSDPCLRHTAEPELESPIQPMSPDSGGHLQINVTDEVPLSTESDSSSEEYEDQKQYDRRQHKAARAWKKIRGELLHGAVASVSIPHNAICMMCQSKNATVLCKQCGSRGYFCEPCAISLHANINILHAPVIQKGSKQYPLTLPTSVAKLINHNCESTSYRTVTCVGLCGIQRDVCFESCSCISESEALLLAGFFPATPRRPQLAFALDLLDLLEALLLECQVAVQDFVAALQYLHNSFTDHTMFSRSLYPILIDCFEEYRYLKCCIKELQFISPDISSELRCPACPQSGGTLFLSIDALFGLCRKKKAGKSVRQPLHDGKCFEPQIKVNDFVANYPKSSSQQAANCSEFLAGDLVRSKSRFASLDETGVIGIACRHEHPLYFYSLRHGERMSYIVYALELLKQRCSGHVKVHLLYDVACTLQRHLKNHKKTDLLDFFDLAIPVFHAYGHKLDCQLTMSARYKTGFGLTDGEVLERLWSYLRRFSKMTKEMRPSHRVDVLTDSLLYYSKLASDNLKNLLPKRYKRALCVAADSQSELQKLLTSSPVPFTENHIQTWLNDEQSLTSEQPSQQDQWTFQYLNILKLSSSIRFYDYSTQLSAYSGDNPTHISTLTSQLQKVEQKLKQMERKHNILQRWTPDSSQYQSTDRMQAQKTRSDVFMKLEKCARERWFLLTIKAKYADGQYMASRISRAIQQETQRLRKLLCNYNELVVSESDHFTWKQVTDLSSAIWNPKNSEETENVMVVPKSVKLAAIAAHVKVLRATEERELIEAEMCNVIDFYTQQYNAIKLVLESCQSSSAHQPFPGFDKGCIFLLEDKLSQYASSLSENYAVFKDYVKLPDLPLNITDHTSESICRPLYQDKCCGMQSDGASLQGEQESISALEEPAAYDSVNKDYVEYPDLPLSITDHISEPMRHQLDEDRCYDMQSDGASLQGEQESFSALQEQAHDDYEDRMILQSYQNSFDDDDIINDDDDYDNCDEEVETNDNTEENDGNDLLNSLVDECSDKDVHLSSNDEDEIDYEEAHRHAIMVKNRLERDEFLQQHRHKEDITRLEVLPRVKVVSAKVARSSQADIRRKTMFLHRPQEELEKLWESVQTDLRKSRIAEALANAPTFNIVHNKK